MKRVFKWIGIGLVGLVVTLLVVVIGLSISASSRLKKSYDIAVASIPIPTETTAVAAGEHLASIHCMGCHGENLAGTVVFEDPVLAYIPSRNLTSGQNGIGAVYTNEDWIRAIQHGVGLDQRPLVVMPASEFHYLSDTDLGNLIAYLRTVPPVDSDLGKVETTFIGRTLIAAGAFGDIINVETIDHTHRPVAAAPGITAEYGEYLVNTSGCRICHGAELAGGKDPNPEAPPGPNLTPGGELIGWSEADFVRALREGRTPTGRQLQAEFMPWMELRNFTDEELQALWLYLQAQPARETVSP